MTMAEYLKSQRTLTESEVSKRAIVHDSHDLTPSERESILKGNRS